MENLGEAKFGTNKLKSQLEAFGIDTTIWGTGGYKTIDHLVKEIEDQEVILGLNEDGELIRISEVVAAMVLCVHDDKMYRLKEERQVFKDGRERIRPSAGHSVFEKMKLGENPDEAILRGITEELNIAGEIILNYIKKIENMADSKSYPGIQTKSTTHFFEAMLEASQFNPEGYIEEQLDKSTYFVWELIDLV